MLLYLIEFLTKVIDMLFTVDGQLNMQMNALSYYGSIAGGKLFVNVKQSYTNTAGTGVSVFRFNLPEKAFVSKLEIKTPEKEISTEYISKTEAQALRENVRSGASPITLDENGIFTSVIGVVNPQQTVDVSFTYIQEVSLHRSIKITLPIQTNERLAQDFTIGAKILWNTAKGEISASGTHQVTVNENTVTLNDGYLPNKDITLELKAEEVSLCNAYKGTQHTLLDTSLPFEPARRQRAQEYLFVVDTSKAVKEQWSNIKNALLSCICALDENESFNIVAFGLSPRLLSIGALKATDSSRASAQIWLDDIKPAGSADIGEALNFAYDLCSRRTEVFLITNSQFINPGKILADIQGRAYSSINIISGDKDYFDVAEQLAQAGGGFAEIIRDTRDIADGLCRALSRNILIGADGVCLKTDKNLVWHMENMGKIYPWDRIQICADSAAQLPEFAEITGMNAQEELHTRYAAASYTKAADILCAIYMADKTDKLYSDDIPADFAELSMNVVSESQTLKFPISSAEGGGSDKPGAVRKNALAFLGMQSTDGSIGSPSETAGRLWDIMTSHPTPSIFMLQIKKAVDFLLDFVHLGEYDLMPDRILDVFELWLEMFPSDTIFAKKIEALVYMNRK